MFMFMYMHMHLFWYFENAYMIVFPIRQLSLSLQPVQLHLELAYKQGKSKIMKQ